MRREDSQLNRIKDNKSVRRVTTLGGYVLKFGKKLSERDAAAYAAESAYFLLLSVVPLITLLLTLATFIPLYTRDDVVALIMKVVPSDFYVYVRSVIEGVYNNAGSTVVSLSVITLLWSASKGIYCMMDGFNNVFDERERNTFIRARFKSIIYTIIILLLFVIVIAGYVAFTHYYQGRIMNDFDKHTILWKVLALGRFATGWLLFYFFILMMYVILPGGFGLPLNKTESVNLRKRLQSQMPGAAFTAVAWILVSRLAMLYVENFPMFSLMYGSLTAVALAMLWLYFCMYSLFIGAVLNYVFMDGALTRVKKMLK